MNLWQTLRQMQYLLRSQTWDGSTKVFHSDSVMILPDLPEDSISSRQTPFALISDLGGDRDAEAPGVLLERIGVTVAAFVPAHEFGEATIIGANRASAVSSVGRGLLEVEEMVHDAVGKAVAANGIRYQVRERSGEGVRPVSGDALVVWRTTVFEGYVSQDRTYAPATRFAATGGAGSVSLSWTAPATRFDKRRAILRRSAGATPPASATAGTGVTLGGSPDGVSAVSATDTIAAGTYSYSLFYAYDEFGTSTDERYSAASTAASVVVT